VKPEKGDVRVFKIVRGKHTTRLVVYDEDRGVPLIQAQLSAAEREALVEALGTARCGRHNRSVVIAVGATETAGGITVNPRSPQPP
jgi:hypothetical protein